MLSYRKTGLGDVADRLEASVKYGAIYGNTNEQGIVETQIIEAIREIRQLRDERDRLAIAIGDLIKCHGEK